MTFTELREEQVLGSLIGGRGRVTGANECHDVSMTRQLLVDGNLVHDGVAGLLIGSNQSLEGVLGPSLQILGNVHKGIAAWKRVVEESRRKLIRNC